MTELQPGLLECIELALTELEGDPYTVARDLDVLLGDEPISYAFRNERALLRGLGLGSEAAVRWSLAILVATKHEHAVALQLAVIQDNELNKEEALMADCLWRLLREDDAAVYQALVPFDGKRFLSSTFVLKESAFSGSVREADADSAPEQAEETLAEVFVERYRSLLVSRGYSVAWNAPASRSALDELADVCGGTAPPSLVELLSIANGEQRITHGSLAGAAWLRAERITEILDPESGYVREWVPFAEDAHGPGDYIALDVEAGFDELEHTVLVVDPREGRSTYGPDSLRAFFRWLIHEVEEDTLLEVRHEETPAVEHIEGPVTQVLQRRPDWNEAADDSAWFTASPEKDREDPRKLASVCGLSYNAAIAFCDRQLRQQFTKHELRLRPGKRRGEFIRDLMEMFPRGVPDDLVEWFRWHDGQEPSARRGLYPGDWRYRALSLDEVGTHFKLTGRVALFQALDSGRLLWGKWFEEDFQVYESEVLASTDSLVALVRRMAGELLYSGRLERTQGQRFVLELSSSAVECFGDQRFIAGFWRPYEALRRIPVETRSTADLEASLANWECLATGGDVPASIAALRTLALGIRGDLLSATTWWPRMVALALAVQGRFASWSEFFEQGLGVRIVAERLEYLELRTPWSATLGAPSVPADPTLDEVQLTPKSDVDLGEFLEEALPWRRVTLAKGKYLGDARVYGDVELVGKTGAKLYFDKINLCVQSWGNLRVANLTLNHETDRSLLEVGGYAHVSKCTISNPGGFGLYVTERPGLAVIANCDFKRGKRAFAVDDAWAQVTDSRVQNVELNAVELERNAWLHARDCTFDRIGRNAIMVEDSSAKLHGCTFRCQGRGLYAENARECVIEASRFEALGEDLLIAIGVDDVHIDSDTLKYRSAMPSTPRAVELRDCEFKGAEGAP